MTRPQPGQAGETGEGFSQALAVTRVAARGLWRSRLPSMAAALAFRTLFAIVPVLVIGLVIVRLVAGQGGVENGINQLLSYSGVTSLVAEGEISVPGVERSPSEPPATEPQPAVTPTDTENASRGSDLDPPGQASAESAPAAVADASSAERLDEWVTDRVDQIMEISLPAIGLVGFATLVFAALSLLFEIERSFNAIYRVRTGRSWTIRLLLFWAVLTLGGVFVFGTFAAGNGFQEWARAQLGSHATSAAVSILGFFVTVIISTLLFALAYQAIPSARVHVRASLAGAFIAAVLWELGKWGLTRSVSYFLGSSTYARVYGALASLPVFMLWVHYTWIIILFGLQISFGLQHIRTWNQAEAEDSAVPVADYADAVAVLVYVASRFRVGEPARPDEIADETDLPGRSVEALLDRLTAAGLLVASADGPDSMRLARPADAIRMDDVVAALDVTGQDTEQHTEESEKAWRSAAHTFRASVAEAVAGKRLSDLVDEPLAGPAGAASAPPPEQADRDHGHAAPGSQTPASGATV
ncbi:MAG: YhjD/YihY/BrkB family envelope integrity protein [Planctomycetota bacterium]